MTLMDTAQLLGNFGEFFGAVAVVVTLGYLAVQIRLNTRMLRANIYTNWVDSRGRALEMMAAQSYSRSENVT